MFFPAGPDPEIDAIRVAGDFQQEPGGSNWDFAGGLPQTKDSSDPRHVRDAAWSPASRGAVVMPW
jgi:hypothetical protein